MRDKLLTCFLLIGLFFSLAPTAMASTTWYVNGMSGSNGSNCTSPTTPCKTIRHAISLAASGDTIRVAAAIYTENFTLGKSLNILGAGASTTIIDGGGVRTVVTISNTSAHVTLSKLTIRNGKATSGGGINNSGTLTLTNSTVSGNWAPIPCIHFFVFCEISAGTASGGGIYNSGALIITNSAGTACSTSLNCRVGTGGAFYSFGGAVTLDNSTVTGSSAYRCSGTCGGAGGAIVNGSGNVAVNNSTVSGNSAGGIFNSGTATLQNSIVSNSGSNCSGTITSSGYNLSSDGSCAFSNSGDRNSTSPVLGTLAYYGGPTPTIPLLTGSPAIDAGNPSGCKDGLGHLLKTDQRGMPRPDPEDSGGCDMGAFERQSD